MSGAGGPGRDHRTRLRVLAHVAAVLGWQASPPLVVARIALAVAAGGLPVLVAWLTKVVLDRIGEGEAALMGPAVGLALAGTATAALPRVTRYADAQYGRCMALAVKSRLYESVGRLPGLASFENPRFHDQLMLAAGSGPAAPAQVVSSALLIGQAVVTCSGFVVTIGLIAPWMLAVVLVAALPGLRAEAALARRRAAMMLGVSQAGRREVFYANLLSQPTAAKEVRLFGLGDLFRSRMLAELRASDREHQRMERRELAAHLPLAVLAALIAGGGLVWAVLSAGAGRLSAGDVVVFVAAVAGVQGALSSIVSGIGGSHEALLLFDNFHAVVNARSALVAGGTWRPASPLRHGIELRDVWFRYADDQPWVLRGVSWTIRAGESTALVGLNGAGKSTLVKLLCRFYDPVNGSIRWDGVDLRELDLAALRAGIGAVFQDFMAYELTAAENIAVGDVGAWLDSARIAQGASWAGCDGMLCALPRGYDTMLTRIYSSHEDRADPSTGVVLSGGQWQRVALARAFMRADRDLLILDEPSAGLDPQAEHAVHTRLRDLRAGRTSLLISHRLGAVRDADTIVVLGDGMIVEAGAHAGLIAANGAYARLFAMQAAGYNGAAVPAGAYE